MPNKVFQTIKDRITEPDYRKAVVVDENGNPVEPSTTQKAKGAAQMVAGTALVGLGVPMLILPGPGAAAVVGGAALASKGHRNLTGRDAIPAEEFIDTAAEQMGAMAKDQARELGEKARQKAPEVRDKLVAGAQTAATKGATLAKEVTAKRKKQK